MDWLKAKKIILISLICVNVFLFVLHKNIDIKYELTNEQIQNIKKVLSENDIGLYTTLPTNYEPMPELELINSKLDLSISNFSTIINSNSETVLLENEDKLTYLVDNTRLLIDGNNFIVDTTDNEEISIITGDKIEYLSNIINDMGSPFKNYILDKEIISNNRIKYEFREVYEGEIIFDNYVQFTIIDDYLYRIQGRNLEIVDFSSKSQEIISSDIALFTFMSIINKSEIYDTSEVVINSIDIIYYKNYENSTIDDVQSVCVPAYRIYTEQGELPFIINAYTNKLMNY